MNRNTSRLEKEFEKWANILLNHTDWLRRDGAVLGLLDLVKTDDALVLREAILNVLAQALLNDNAESVRIHAAEALGKIEDARAVDPLTQALQDSNSAVRSTATQALGKIGKPAAESLIEALKNSDEDVRMYAAKGLGEIKDARAIKPLIEALRIQTRWGGAEGSAAQALTDIGEPAVEPLSLMLKDSDENVRLLATISLGDISDIRAVEPLIEALKDSNKKVQKAAASSLKKIGGEKAEKTLKDYRKQLPWYQRL